jgi:hypothetical protein
MVPISFARPRLSETRDKKNELSDESALFLARFKYPALCELGFVEMQVLIVQLHLGGRLAIFSILSKDSSCWSSPDFDLFQGPGRTGIAATDSTFGSGFRCPDEKFDASEYES